MKLLRIDHVQLAMPVGAEDEATSFYEGLLGLPRVPKPAALAVRGGCWFELDDVRLHLGADADFRPAKKAHPALVVEGFDELVERLEGAGVGVRLDDEIVGVRRAHIDDPFGNRIELIDVNPAG